jgi:uncharacterized protein YndB with AHSA1/START domain
MSAITVEVFVNVAIKLAYRAFTNATALREWLCDVATVEPHPQGRLYLWWNGDFYSSGHYLELAENQQVKFRWFSNIDVAPTEVTVTFTEKDGGTLVRLIHEVPVDSAWEKTAHSFRENWAESFRNLKSVLETGIDPRVADRPIFGISIGDFTPEQAKTLGVPVKAGLRLDSVIEGRSAHKSGLQRNDVIVELNGQPIKNGYNDMLVAIAGKKGGEFVDAVIYRGAEKKTINLELGKRPMPEVPFDPAELAKRARGIYEPALAEVEKTFEGFSDAQAMARPEPNEWSALETIAHLISGERFNVLSLTGLIDGYEPVTDGFGSNVHAQVQATVAAHPSIQLMLDALRRASEETLAYVALIPEEFAANKASYYRFGAGLLSPNVHLSAHLDQIKAALAAARG